MVYISNMKKARALVMFGPSKDALLQRFAVASRWLLVVRAVSAAHFTHEVGWRVALVISVDDFKQALTVIGGCAALGAAIDFWLGRDGAKVIKGALETSYLWLADVKMRNFGRKEAELAVEWLDAMAGRYLFSWRRLKASAITVMLAVVYFPPLYEPILIVGWDMLSYTVGVALGFSATRFLAFVASRIAGNGALRNILAFTTFLYVNGCIAAFSPWAFRRITGFISSLIAIYVYEFDNDGDPTGFENGLRSALVEYIQHVSNNFPVIGSYESVIEALLRGPYVFVYLLLGDDDFKPHFIFVSASVPGMLRSLMSAVFIFGILIKLSKSLVMTVFERIVESEKPVFTALFSSLAIVAKAISLILIAM